MSDPSDPVSTDKPGALPVKRPSKKAAQTPEQAKQSLERAKAQRLAQVVNLHIAGFSLAQIGDAIGASADEVDQMLASDAARYVRSQPALRTYVRNWISQRYTKMLDADWEQATDKGHPHKLEHQDRVLRILDSMRKLHGADAPVQTEVKIDAAPEAVERLVSQLAASQGLGYDDSVFDVVDAELVHEAAEQAPEATEVSGNAADQPQEGESDDGF